MRNELERGYPEFDGPVKCEVKDGYILRVYGLEFVQAFLRGTHSEVELWAKPLKTSVIVDLEELEYRFGPMFDYVDFYLDRLPWALGRKARCWATVWLYLA
jgi:hypothetical protein